MSKIFSTFTRSLRADVGFETEGIPMPKVENFCGGVRVTIERTVFMKLSHVCSSVGSDVTSSVTSMSPVKLTERQQDMLELIRKNPFISAQQMSVVLSVVKRTIERDLADLQKKGILIREGNTSAGHWEIIDPTDRRIAEQDVRFGTHISQIENCYTP